MFFSLCYSLGGFKIFCLFAMFALVNIKYKRKPAKNEINVYSACLWFITRIPLRLEVWMVFIIRNGARCWTAPWSLSATATAACRCWHCPPGAAAFTIRDEATGTAPEAVASLLHAGKVQLFCADSIDGESLLAGNSAPRRRAEMQEKYFLYLTTELAPRILALTADEPKAEADEKAAKAASTPVLWCAGVDTGAYQAVNCRLRRPELFAGAIGLSGLYDMSRFMGSEADDLILRNSPLNALA